MFEHYNFEWVSFLYSNEQFDAGLSGCVQKKFPKKLMIFTFSNSGQKNLRAYNNILKL